MLMEAKEQRVGGGPLLPSHGFWGLNSGGQV